MRAAGTAVATVAAALALAAPAGAHVGVEPGEAPADSYAKLDFQVPHGCEGSPTTELRVQIPKSVPSVTPQVHPGWEVTTKEGPKDPVDLHGERVTRGVSEVTWTAAGAGPLPDERLDVFGMSVKLPAGRAGETVVFPAVQRCERGQTAWIQVPAAGESEDDLESPAPAVVLTAAEAGDGHGASGDEATAEDGDDDGPSTALVVVALALGGLGLLAGLAALAVAGRRR
jgi:periplasmic copper chaperone A